MIAHLFTLAGVAGFCIGVVSYRFAQTLAETCEHQEAVIRELRGELVGLRRRNFGLECAVADSTMRASHAAMVEDALETMATDPRTRLRVPTEWEKE